MLLHLKNEYNGITPLSLMGLAGTVMVKAEIMPINTVIKVIKILCLLHRLSFLLINTVSYFFL